MATGKEAVAAQKRIAEKSDPNQVVFTPENEKKLTYQNDNPNWPEGRKQAEQFPTGEFSKGQPEDEHMDMIYELQKDKKGNDTGVTPFGQLTWQDKYTQYMLKQQQLKLHAEFEDWFAQTYDLMEPAQKEIARKLFPRFYEARKQKLAENLELMKEIARVRIEGVKTKEDLYLLFAMERGDIDMDQMLNVLTPELTMNRKGAYGLFERGILNISVRGERPNPYDLNDAARKATGFQPARDANTTFASSKRRYLTQGERARRMYK